MLAQPLKQTGRAMRLPVFSLCAEKYVARPLLAKVHDQRIYQTPQMLEARVSFFEVPFSGAENLAMHLRAPLTT